MARVDVGALTLHAADRRCPAGCRWYVRRPTAGDLPLSLIDARRRKRHAVATRREAQALDGVACGVVEPSGGEAMSDAEIWAELCELRADRPCRCLRCGRPPE